MNKLNVGDYIRTKEGNIFKIIGGNEDNYEIDIDYSKLEQTEEYWYESNRYNDNGYWFDNENIIKSSPNIIDLIEVGDYVNGIYIEGNNGKYLETLEDDMENSRLGHIEYYKIWADDIETVVTHEQFENISYKVGE